MGTNRAIRRYLILWGGDVITLVIFTLVGFATHESLDAGPLRMLTTFIPLLIAWILVAVPAGVLRLETARDFRQIWRPAWAMLLAAPWAVILRGLLLNRPIAPIFALVLAGSGVLAILIWRALFCLIFTRLSSE
jgi:hypothetical protein